MVQSGSLNSYLHPSLVVILISADAEWSVVRKFYSDARIDLSPFGEWFQVPINLETVIPSSINKVTPPQIPVIFFQGGWGKITAAASTQYIIDTWKPELLVNFGTCGGFLGQVDRFDIFIVDETVVYDIFEQMGDPMVHIAHYSTKIDLSWFRQVAPPPYPLRRSLLISGDRDLIPGDIPDLIQRYGASAGDWESGAIAYTAKINKQRLLIIRGVTDLVGNEDGEAYQDNSIFPQNTEIVMDILLKQLMNWVLVGFANSRQLP